MIGGERKDCGGWGAPRGYSTLRYGWRFGNLGYAHHQHHQQADYPIGLSVENLKI